MAPCSAKQPKDAAPLVISPVNAGAEGGRCIGLMEMALRHGLDADTPRLCRLAHNSGGVAESKRLVEAALSASGEGVLKMGVDGRIGK